MKAFLKQIAASFLGSCLSAGALAAAGFFILVAAVGFFVKALVSEFDKGLYRFGTQTETVPVQSGSVLVIDLSRGFSDSPTFSPANTPGFFSGTKGRFGLLDTILALETARRDDDVRAVLLLGGDFSGGNGFASTVELRDALLSFRAGSEKPVFAYLPSPTYKDYLLATAADEVWIHPFAELPLCGLSSEGLYFKDAFEKIGLGVQITRVGTHKSAVEPLISNTMSAEDRAQRKRLVDAVWSRTLRHILTERASGKDEAGRAALEKNFAEAVASRGLVPAQEAVEKDFVDAALYEDEMLERMTALAGTDEETRTFPQIALEDYLRARGIAAEPPLNAAVPATAENSVAVVYAEGEIVNGVGSNADVGGQWFSRALRELRGDDAVKAVVLRVNSPGGSVFAGEQIRREAELLARTKPLVVSMGDVAASGGYWISVPAEKVFADPLTVTGSIGVFGVLFNLEKLGEKIGVASAAATTGPFAELDTLRRAKTPAEMAVFQKATEDIYGKFLRLVADARGMSVADVDAVAQGQVWTGLHAKTLNLVDEFGGLTDALAFARRAAGLGEDAPVVSVPGEINRLQPLFDLTDDRPAPVAFAGTDFAKNADPATRAFAESLRRLAARLRAFNDPNGLYARLPFDVPAE